MIRRLLVPLDGSPTAEAAVPVASFLARSFEAAVILVHVIEKKAPRRVHGQPHLQDSESAERYLEETARRDFTPGTRVDIHVHTDGADTVAGGIVEHEGELQYDLIIMCTHGRGKTMKLLFGSIAQEVSALGNTPVLIVSPDKKNSYRRLPWRSILVPLDTQPTHDLALRVARDLAAALRATLHLVVIVPTFGTLPGRSAASGRLLPGTVSRMLDMNVEQAKMYLAERKREIEGSSLTVTASVLRGEPADSIVKASRSLDVDLLVLATHGRMGWEGFWTGSIAHKVSSRCELSVLLVPVSDGREPAAQSTGCRPAGPG
jgi:nucleotide-binding universal stress UspA family protein